MGHDDNLHVRGTMYFIDQLEIPLDYQILNKCWGCYRNCIVNWATCTTPNKITYVDIRIIRWDSTWLECGVSIVKTKVIVIGSYSIFPRTIVLLLNTNYIYTTEYNLPKIF